ncbi:hypothetical protein [Serinibacter arcticus]|uniref:Lipoprotein n=1 Tax=Serinibacter arcticus TaxID=1655435 RepID=A0A4Z1E6H2_9MICO|nr:hypothetical protein [Serinibacter arcticus]TGO06468.1 hypothetical protein SERN_0660 [Serinibacter arcticus]
MSRTVTRIAAGAAAGVVALALSACSPILTTKPYAAGDGTRVAWEGTNAVRGENVIVLAAEQGGEGRILGGLTNQTNEPVEITFGFAEGSSETVTVEANSTLLMNGTDEGDIILDDVPVAPGANVEMTFATPSLGQISLPVPVLDGTFPEYTDLVP